MVNKQKLKAYGLDDSYVNFRSGSGAALDAEIASSIRRASRCCLDYWSPTPLMGRYKLIQLEEPPFDAEAWKTLTDADNPEPKPTRSLASKLSIGVSTPFQKEHPQIAAVFRPKSSFRIGPLNQGAGDNERKPHACHGTWPRRSSRSTLRCGRRG